MVYGDGLENRSPVYTGAWVRIPPPPPTLPFSPEPIDLLFIAVTFTIQQVMTLASDHKVSLNSKH